MKMEGKQEYIPVREYAARCGISVKTAYKKISNNSLDYEEREINGRKVKYIKVDQSADLPNPPDVTTPERASEPQENEAGILELLSAQLREKDRQIQEKDRQIQEKDKQISQLLEQISRDAELLRGSQQLQAHAQHLLEQHEQDPQDPIIEAQATEAPGQEDPPKKRRSWWAWLFGEVE